MASAKLTLILNLKDRLFNSKLKKMTGKIDKLKMKHAQAFAAMRAEVPMLGRGLDLLTNKYVLMGAAIVGIGLLAFSAGKKAAAFNHEFLQIKQMNLDKPKAQMDSYKGKIKDAAFEIGTDLNDTTKAFYDLQSGTGLFGDKAVAVFKKVGKYSVATGADLGASMNATVKAMEAMGLGIKDIDGYLESNAKTVQTGIVTYAELARVQTEYLGSAAGAGQGVDIANKVFAGFTKIAKSSDIGANMTKTFFDGITEQAGKIEKTLDIDLYKNGNMLGADKILEKIAGKFKGMSQEAQHLAIKEIGGPEGLKAMLKKVGVDAKGLLKTFETFDASKFDLSKALKNAKGDVTVLGNIVKNRWNVVLADLGEAILPIVATGLNAINKVIVFARNNWGTIAPIIIGISTALVTLKIATYAASGGFKTMFFAIKTGIMSIPIIGWILAIVAAIATLVSMTDGWKAQWENLKQTFSLMWEGMKLSWEYLTGSMYSAWMWLQDGIVKGYKWAQNLIGNLSDELYNKQIKQIDAEAKARRIGLEDTHKAILENKRLTEKTAEWKLKWKSDDEMALDENGDFVTGTNGANGAGSGLSQTLGDQVTKVTGAAAQVRNVTINIDSLNKGGINTQNTTLANMSAEEIANWFNEAMLRVVRNVELSMG